MKKTIIFPVLICLLLACNLLSGTTLEEATPVEQITELPSPTALQATPQPKSSTTLSPIIGPVYYVGQANCSDSGPGNAQTPFCTFETALNQLQPGGTLTIQPGLYREPLVISHLAGQSNAPIIIQGQAGVIFDGGCPAFPCGLNDVTWERDEETGLVMVEESQYLILRGLTVQNVIAVGVTLVGGSYITIENVTVNGAGNAGLLALHTDHLTVSNNDIGRTQLGWRDEDGSPQFGAHEAMSIVAVTDFEIAHNTVHDTLKEGIDIKESSARGAVHHNTVEHACAVGIYLNEAEQVQVHHNRVRRSGYYLTAGGQESLCETYPEYGPYFDQYYGTGMLLAVGDLGELSRGYLAQIDLYQNVIWEVHGNGIEFWDEWRESGTGEGQMTGNRVFNNTIYNSDLGGIRLQDVESTEVVNNILVLNDEDAITGEAIANNTISHNLFYFEHDWQEPAGSDYVVGDPLFVDPTNGDFKLQAGSPAIDAGLDMGLPALGQPDIGAFEYNLADVVPEETQVAGPSAPVVADDW